MNCFQESKVLDVGPHVQSMELVCLVNQWKVKESEQHSQLLSKLEDLSNVLLDRLFSSSQEAAESRIVQTPNGVQANFEKFQRWEKLEDVQPTLHCEHTCSTCASDDIFVCQRQVRFESAELATQQQSPSSAAFPDPPQLEDALSDLPSPSLHSSLSLHSNPPESPEDTKRIVKRSRITEILGRITGFSGVDEETEEERLNRELRARAMMLNAAGADDEMDSVFGKHKSMGEITAGCLRTCSQKILQSLVWDFIVAFAIITYAIYMGYQVDWAVKNIDAAVPLGQYIVDFTYTFFFTVELGIRLTAEGVRFWSCQNKSMHWNYLDTLIVATSLTEETSKVLTLWQNDSSNESGRGSLNIRQFRLVRIFLLIRVIKIFRVARVIRFVRALRTLIHSILHTLKSVVWALVLLLFFIYVFAIILTGAISDHKRVSGCDGSPILCKFWGDLPKSMLSLFSAVAGGISWYEIVNPLMEHLHPGWTWVFLFYVCFVYFAVLNVITGVFCESAIESAKSDVDMAIRDALERKKIYVKKLEALFSWIDTDGSDEITLDELQMFLENHLSGVFFEVLELEVDHPSEVLNLIDTDGSGELSKAEFIEGVCRLRGPATALQIARLEHHLKQLDEHIGSFSNSATSARQKKEVNRV